MRSPGEIAAEIGQRVRSLRLHRNLSQAELSARAGVGLRTLQRLETHGSARLALLLRVALVLDSTEPFERLFPLPEARSIDEVLGRQRPARKRARRRATKTGGA